MVCFQSVASYQFITAQPYSPKFTLHYQLHQGVRVIENVVSIFVSRGRWRDLQEEGDALQVLDSCVPFFLLLLLLLLL